MTDPDLDELEKQTIEQIEKIRREYQKAIDPYLQVLVRIRASRPPTPVVVDICKIDQTLIEEAQ